MSFFDIGYKLKPYLAFTKKWYKWLALAAIILLAWVGLKSCSTHEAHQKKTYTIGRGTTWYPLQLMGKDRNLEAFTNELMDAVSAETGLRFAWLETNPAYLFERLESGLCDAVISTLEPDAVNRDRYLFSKTFFELGPVLIVGQNSKAANLKDMEGKTIGIPAGSSLSFDAARQGAANVYNITVNSFENINRALEALYADKIDGVIMDNLRAYQNVGGFYQGKLKIISVPLTNEGLHLVALKSPSSEDLITSFDEALEKLIQNGEYTEMLTKWTLIDPEKQYLKFLDK